MNKGYRILRYEWPLHFVLLVTNWLPDNVVFLRFRGYLVSIFLGSCEGDLRLGRNITIQSPWNIHIGNNIYIAYGCWIIGHTEIYIEDEVLIGPYTIIISGNHTRMGGSYRYGSLDFDVVSIGAGSWIGGHVSILAGSRVGKGSLIAAGSVINKKLPNNVLVAGVPGEIKKKLSL